MRCQIACPRAKILHGPRTGGQRVDRVRQRAAWAELRLQEPELRLSQQLSEARRGQHQGEVPARALYAAS
jgi:hypothetical protein